MTLPRTDPLNPPQKNGVATRGVRIEKIVEGDIQEQIDASIPAQTLPDHSIFSQVHDNLYFLTVGSGLTVNIASGRAQLDNVVYEHGPSAWTLAASSTSYVVVTAVGAIFASTVPFQSGQIPLWRVTTDATSVQIVTDCRAVIARGGGGGGGGGASTLDQAYDGGTPGSGSGRTINATDDAVVIQNSEADSNAILELNRAVADPTLPVLDGFGIGEAQPRLRLTHQRLAFGPGGATVPDTQFYRPSANIMRLDNFSTTDTQGSTMEYVTVTAPTAAPSNMSRMYARVFGTGTSMFIKDTNGRELGPLGEKAQATIFGRGPSGGLDTGIGATWSDGLWGSLSPVGSWTVTGAAATVANDTAGSSAGGRYCLFTQTAATTGLDAGIESAATFFSNAGGSYLIRFAINTASNIRMFVGVAAQTLATMVGADNPGTNHLGIQFSTPRGDANWKFTERGTSTQTVTDSTIAVSLAPMYIQIIQGTLTQMVLYDQTFTPVASRAVGVLGKPAGATLLSIICGVEAESNGLNQMRVFQISHHNREV